MFNPNIPFHRYAAGSSSSVTHPTSDSPQSLSGSTPNTLTPSQQRPSAQTDFILLSDLFGTNPQPANQTHFSVERLNEPSSSANASAPSTTPINPLFSNPAENTPGFFSSFLQLCSMPSPMPAPTEAEKAPQKTPHPLDAILFRKTVHQEAEPVLDQVTQEFVDNILVDPDPNTMPDAPWHPDDEDEPAFVYTKDIPSFNAKDKGKGKAISFVPPSFPFSVVRDQNPEKERNVQPQWHAANPWASIPGQALQNPSAILSAEVNPFQVNSNPNKRKREADQPEWNPHFPTFVPTPAAHSRQPGGFYTTQEKQEFINYYKQHPKLGHLDIVARFSNSHFPVSRSVTKTWVEEAGVVPFSLEHQKFQNALSAFLHRQKMNSATPLTRKSASVQEFIKNYQKESGRSETMLKRWLGRFFKNLGQDGNNGAFEGK